MNFLKLTFVLFLLISIEYAFANEKQPLLAYSKDGLWHFIDVQGKELFEPKKIEDVLGFSEGLIRILVKENDMPRVEYLDLNGNTVLEPDFDYAYDFFDGYALVFKFIDKTKTTKKFGFIDKKGKLLLNCILKDASHFAEGLAYVSGEFGNGYIDSSGKIKINLETDAGFIFSEGLAAVNNRNFKFGYINKKGEQVIDFLFDEAGNFKDGFAKFNKDNKFGFIDKTGKERIPPAFDFVRNFSEGLAFVGLYDINFRTYWALIDTAGIHITKYIFSRVQDFSEELAAVRDTAGWGFINKKGEFVIPAHFYYADSFKDGIAWASDKKNNTYGFINKDGRYVLTIPAFDKAFELRFNRKVY